MQCREVSEKRIVHGGRRILSFLLVWMLMIVSCSTGVLADEAGGNAGDAQATASQAPTSAPIPSPSESFYVYDGASVLSAETESAVVEKCKALDESYGAQIVVMTMPLMPGTGADARKAYAAEVLDAWGIGKESGNGLLLVLSIADDDYWVAPTEQFQESFTLSVLKSLMADYLEADFRNKAYDDGVTKFVTAAAEKAETYVRVQQLAAGAGSADPESGKTQDGKEEKEEENVFLSILKGIGTFILVVVILLAVLLAVVYVHGQQVRRKRREARRRRAQARGGSAAPARPEARSGSRGGSGTRPTADNSDYRAFMERYK